MVGLTKNEDAFISQSLVLVVLCSLFCILPPANT